MTLTATLAGAIGMLAKFAFFFGGYQWRSEQSTVGSVRWFSDGGGAGCGNAGANGDLTGPGNTRRTPWGRDLRSAAVGWPRHLSPDDGGAPDRYPATETQSRDRHLFIVNPLHGGEAVDWSCFASHRPPRRWRALRQLADRCVPARFHGLMPPMTPRSSGCGTNFGIPEC